MKFFATCSRGLEFVLQKELQNLGVKTEMGRGGIEFSGYWKDCYRVNLHSRIAQRIFFPLGRAKIKTEQDLYQFTRSIRWEQWFGVENSIRVHANLFHATLTHSHFAALKIKDAIVDYFRAKTGNRPNVGKEQSDIIINLHLKKDLATISFDTSGRSLHFRGYRLPKMQAPLRETLAAGIIALSEWDGKTIFYDPMCGSGTLPIEAALIASSTAPGLLQPHFAFMNYKNFDEEIWQQIIDEAKSTIHPPFAHIIGADISGASLEDARLSAGSAGVEEWIEWKNDKFQNAPQMNTPGICICNPPYGERLGDVKRLKKTYRELGDFFKQKLPGWSAHVFSGNLNLLKNIGLKSNFRKILYNGAIECRLAQFKILPRKIDV